MWTIGQIVLILLAVAAGIAGGLWLGQRTTLRLPGRPPPGPTRNERRSSVEALVLSAGLEDSLCHLVEVYGPEYLDTFLERRIRRNVRPFLSEIDASQTTPIVTLWREHAEDAEAALKRTIEAVRRDPTPPT